MKPTRRDILRAGAIGSASLLAANPLHAAAKPGASAPGLGAEMKPFRIAHLTDMHVQPERRAGEGYTAALESLAKLTPPPDLIITGGDHIMDSTESTLQRARQQWAAPWPSTSSPCRSRTTPSTPATGTSSSSTA
jgi:Icc protein